MTAGAGRLRILFVCLGNICRSPTAHAATREALVDAGLDAGVELDSAGIGDWHRGNPPDRRMLAAARNLSLQLEGTARQVRPDELGAWDLILAMDHSNLVHLRAMTDDADVRARMRMFRDFDPAGAGEDVPDPYYGPEQGFADVVAICRRAARGLVDDIVGRLAADADR